MKLDLYIRNLQTGDREQKVFESEQEALEYLKNRPKFAEVLGVASDDVPPELNDQLRAATRPLDEEEKLLDRQRTAALEDEARKRAQKEQKRAVEEAAKHRDEIANADPNRPLEIRYRFNEGLSVADPVDTRTITDEARAAMMAWIEERNSWVASRGNVVGEAKVSVYPGPLPDRVTERVDVGTFIPVTAPKKDS
ncbi:MAG: hypothetical protein DRI90_25505 [Deltaproteobacteria bacterium]|nr:MAG: hypothetical protein DRI90_25505 [Deltaproteobacteria bacterium]